ncbi:hypothetical protein Fmac_007144 [Flemingia macrophylla]|uniref:Uncharacterized protein n=1 Tax=Flemingia macrophylla TaxID=520843 RepID=A0ABD1NCM1_9FABA
MTWEAMIGLWCSSTKPPGCTSFSTCLSLSLDNNPIGEGEGLRRDGVRYQSGI